MSLRTNEHEVTLLLKHTNNQNLKMEQSILYLSSYLELMNMRYFVLIFLLTSNREHFIKTYKNSKFRNGTRYFVLIFSLRSNEHEGTLH